MKFCHGKSTTYVVKAKLLLWTEGHFLCLSSVDWKSSKLKPDWKDLCLWFLLTYLAVISEIDSRCLWKILETFGEKKKSNNEPMGPHVILGTPAFCLDQFCCWTMLERTVKNTPVWSLLFLDCTLYRRIIWQEEEAAAFSVSLWKGWLQCQN